MQRQFQPYPSKRFRSRALGTLLLALPLSGFALQLPSAQAQPAPTLPTKKSPLSLEQKAAVTKLLALSRQEHVCKALLDLKVENATLDEVISRAKTMLPGQTVMIEVRGANPVRVSFDLKGVRVGDVLDHVAALAGSKLWVLSNGLLIAPKSQLTGAELEDVKRYQGGEWVKGADEGGAGWSASTLESRMFTRAIAQEVTGSDAQPLPAKVVKTTFGNFSPESQTMLQALADFTKDDPLVPPLLLSSESPVTVDTSHPNGVSITFDPNRSDPNQGSISIQHVIIQARPRQ